MAPQVKALIFCGTVLYLKHIALASIVPPQPAFVPILNENNIDSSKIEYSPRHTSSKYDHRDCLPVGAVFELNLVVPVIGRQRFHLKILNTSLAELNITGTMQVYDILQYNIDASGSLGFCLSDQTERTMRRFRSSISSVEYSKETDTAIVIVQTPIHKKLKIELERVFDEVCDKDEEL